MSENSVLKYLANNVRKGILEAVYTAKSGHPGGSLGITDMLTYLYTCEMAIDFENPNRDRFVLSKGHCVPAVYSLFVELGYAKKEKFMTLRQIGSEFQGHPCIEMPGIEMSTGSLGQGFAVAAGMALSAKMDGKSYNVYTILGDGEIQEGVVWETAMFAGSKKLGNLIAIIDNNNLQSDGEVTDVCSVYPIDEKFSAFNWNVFTVNGHDFDDIRQTFEKIHALKNGKPNVIIMRTAKGKGVSFMENQVGWHGVAPNSEQYTQAIAELDKNFQDLNVTETIVTEFLQNNKKTVTNNVYNSIKSSPKTYNPICATSPKATRDSYGEALKELAEVYPELVVLDADLSKSTKTCIFAKDYPERFVNTGIAEQNLIGISAGLATTGKKVFSSSFAMFIAGRGYEFIRNSVAYPKLNVNIGASHAGISVGEDGASHQCNEDIALMRTIPGMIVVNPCDDRETKLAVKAALDVNSPVYIRVGRFSTPQINGSDYNLELGKGVILKDGTDITIIATGLMVNESLIAAEQLKKNGINAQVVNIHTIKPIDKNLVLQCAAETAKIVTVEEHSIIGGLGSAVIEAICEENPVPVHRIGINDRFGFSGPAKDLLEKFGLCSENIYNTVKNILGK